MICDKSVHIAFYLFDLQVYVGHLFLTNLDSLQKIFVAIILIKKVINSHLQSGFVDSVSSMA